MGTIANGDQEFSSLEDDANIYRLVGPVLLKQDTSEAKSTVDSRLGYIDQEMCVSSAPGDMMDDLLTSVVASE